jgi:hypothetical protein
LGKFTHLWSDQFWVKSKDVKIEDSTAFPEEKLL